MDKQATVVIEEKVVDRLLKKIILLEKSNLKTKESGYSQIVRKIMAYIEEEVECY